MGPLRHYHRKLDGVCFAFLASRTLKTSYRAFPASSSLCKPCFAFVLGASARLFASRLERFRSSCAPPFRAPLIFLRCQVALSRSLLEIFLDQALDRLVLTSFRIAAFTPSTYQPCRLQGVLPAFAVGYFFSRGASRLDAFSVYPVRTSLPCYAVGTTTVAPVVRPFRSSRTRNSSSHDSYAHDG